VLELGQDLWKAHATDPRHPLIIDALDDCREEMRCEGSDGWCELPVVVSACCFVAASCCFCLLLLLPVVVAASSCCCLLLLLPPLVSSSLM